MISAGPDPLLERGAELEGLAAQLTSARAAAGSVALLEAPAGQGKTALLRVLRGTADGLRVLSATGAPLERDFAFGIVRQLFEAELRRADAERRARLPAGAAALAEPVFGVEASGDGHATLYGLYWLCANLAAEQPLLVVVDDAHWADAPSLRFLDALARRVEDLPVLLAIAARPAEPGAEQALLDGLATAPATTLLRPAPLSAEGVSSLVRARMDAPEPAFVQACFETTAGNPLLLTELLRAAPFAGRADESDAVRTTVPGTVARTVTARIRRLSPGALAVARATAVLGDATSVSRVAALSDLNVAEAEGELEVLARAALIEDGRFVHPMIAEVVDADLGVERARLHRRAARLLADDGALDGVVATHLLAAGPESDPWAAGVLAAAGRRALTEGAPDVALRLLQHAAPADAGILLSLGLAQFRTGLDPLPTLDEAAARGTPAVAAEAARLAATALLLRSEPRAAAARLRAALAGMTPNVLAAPAENSLPSEPVAAAARPRAALGDMAPNEPAAPAENTLPSEPPAAAARPRAALGDMAPNEPAAPAENTLPSEPPAAAARPRAALGDMAPNEPAAPAENTLPSEPPAAAARPRAALGDMAPNEPAAPAEDILPSESARASTAGRSRSGRGSRHPGRAASPVLRAKPALHAPGGADRGHEPDILPSEPAALPAELAGELEEQLVEALAYSDDDAAEYLRLLERAEGSERPALLCHLAHARALAGAPRDEVLPLARRALAATRVFARLGVERFAALWAIEALLAVEAAPEAGEAARAMSDLANRSGSRASAGAAAWMEARCERRFGHLRRAADLAPHALELADGQLIPAMAVGSTLVGILLDRGDVAGARAAAAELPEPGPTGAVFGLWAVRARLLLADGRPEEALAALDRQEAANTARHWLVGIHEDTHVLRARVLAALGRTDEARALATEQIALARQRGTPGAEAIALIARAALPPAEAALPLAATPHTAGAPPAAASPDTAGAPPAAASPPIDAKPRAGASPAATTEPTPIADLRAAVDAARRAPLPLVHATALAELGAALRRAGHRAEARTPLREARDLAHRCGATGLEARVHEELVVAGARPQRLAFSGVDALTPSERRVAELAVRGLRNREIAEALFVSLKTVEVHLGRVYNKLGIKGRSQLADALAA